jgi:chromosome partitioning protein
MKTVAMFSRKGGAGKTTLAMLLASAASAAGHNSVVCDLDPQRSATLWHRRKGELAAVENGPAVVPIENVTDPKVWVDGMEWDRPSKEEETEMSISFLLNQAKAKQTDFLVLNTPTSDDLTSTLSARAADAVLLPCRLDALDLAELESILSVIRSLRKRVYVVANAVSSIRGVNKQASDELAKKGAWVAPRCLMNRAAFAEGPDIDWAHLESHDAGREIEALYRWLCDVLGMPPRREVQKVA